MSGNKALVVSSRAFVRIRVAVSISHVESEHVKTMWSTIVLRFNYLITLYEVCVSNYCKFNVGCPRLVKSWLRPRFHSLFFEHLLDHKIISISISSCFCCLCRRIYPLAVTFTASIFWSHIVCFPQVRKPCMSDLSGTNCCISVHFQLKQSRDQLQLQTTITPEKTVVHLCSRLLAMSLRCWATSSGCSKSWQYKARRRLWWMGGRRIWYDWMFSSHVKVVVHIEYWRRKWVCWFC